MAQAASITTAIRQLMSRGRPPKSTSPVRQAHTELIAALAGNVPHLIYAGADFILMPSRVEPCGLNQLYALRYGTVPVVRNTGGLHDTVVDYGDKGGYGIRFNHVSVGDMTHGIWRAVELFNQPVKLKEIRQQIMQLDFSWESSVQGYLQLYESMRS